MNMESELISQVEALRQRCCSTKLLYKEVCALLFFQYGITPTANKLYHYVRKGTMSTPAEVLSQFWNDLRNKSRVDIDLPALPATLRESTADAIADIWRQANAAARSELELVRSNLASERDALLQENTQARKDALDARNALEKMGKKLATAQEGLSNAQMALELERQAHKTTAARLQEVQALIRQSNLQLQQFQRGFSEDLARAQEAVAAANHRADHADKRALIAIDGERQAQIKAGKIIEALRGRLSQANAKEQQLVAMRAEAVEKIQQQLAASISDNHELNQVILTLQDEAHELRAQQLALQQEIVRSRAGDRTIRTRRNRLLSRSTERHPTGKRRARALKNPR